MFIGISIINHPFWGTTIFGSTHIVDVYGKCKSTYTIHVHPMVNDVQTSLVLAYIYIYRDGLALRIFNYVPDPVKIFPRYS